MDPVGGSDLNSGDSQCSPLKTLNQAQVIAASRSASTILIRRSTTCVLSSTLTIQQQTSIGAYGSGDSPILKSPPAIQFAIAISPSAHDLTISDIAFDTTTPPPAPNASPTQTQGFADKTAAATAIQAAGKNISVSNCTAINVCDFVNANGNPTNFALVGCRDTSPTSVRGYFCWVQGSNIAILGNTTMNSTREHCIRVGGAQGVSICGNTFTNLDRSTVDPQDIGKATINCQLSRDVLIANNLLAGGPLGVGPLGGADGVAHPEQTTENVVVADNQITNATVAITCGAHNVLEIGNIVHETNGRCFYIQPVDPTISPTTGKPAYTTRSLTNITLDSNTGITASAAGNFLFVDGPPLPAQISLLNNTFSAPNFTTGSDQNAIVYVAAPDLSGFRTIYHNSWPIPQKTTWVPDAAMYVFPVWSDPTGYKTPAQWVQYPQVQGDVFGSSSPGK